MSNVGTPKMLPNVLDPESDVNLAPPAVIRHHCSMAHPGDLIVQAESTQFRIPRYILAANGDGIYSANFGSEAVWYVEDTAEEFEAFFNALMTPFNSLHSPTPNLEMVCHVLHLAHKYNAVSLEAQALRVLEKLIFVDMFAAPEGSDTLGSEVETAFKVLRLVDALDILRTLAEAYLRWMQTSSHAFRASDILQHADVCEVDIRAQLYYQAMIRGPEHWGKDAKLRTQHKVTIGIGAASCVNALAQTQRDWMKLMVSVSLTRPERHKVCPYATPADVSMWQISQGSSTAPMPCRCVHGKTSLDASAAAITPHNILGRLAWTAEHCRPTDAPPKDNTAELDCFDLTRLLCVVLIQDYQSKLVHLFQLP